MSEKAMRAILIGVVVVVAAWAAVSLLGGRGGRGPAAASVLQKTLAGVHEPAVAAVRVVNGRDTVELTRSAGRWLADGWPTDSDAVAGFWTAVDSARVTELASSNPAHQADLGVKGPGAIEVTFRKRAGDSARVLLGRAGPYYPSAYARVPNRDDVWILSGDLRRQASRPVEEWRDRTVVRVDTGAVRAIRVTRADTTVALARTDSAWTANGRPAAPKIVQSLLAGLADVQASGFAPDSVHPAPGARSVVALGAGGDTLVALRFAARKPSGFWTTVRGDSVVYQLPGYRVDAVTPTEGLLAPKR